DRWDPQNQRLLDAGRQWNIRDPRAFIAPAETELRPAIVASRRDDVDLVATVWSVLGRQDGAGRFMNRQAELIAVPVREDLGGPSGLAHERIVRRNRPVVAQPEHFAVDAIPILRFLAERRSGCHVEQPVSSKGDSRAARPGLEFASENFLESRDDSPVESP